MQDCGEITVNVFSRMWTSITGWSKLTQIFCGVKKFDVIVIVLDVYLTVHYPCVSNLFGTLELPGLVSEVGSPFGKVVRNIDF